MSSFSSVSQPWVYILILWATLKSDNVHITSRTNLITFSGLDPGVSIIFKFQDDANMQLRGPKNVPARTIRGFSDLIFCLLHDTVPVFQETSKKARLEATKYETTRNQKDIKDANQVLDHIEAVKLNVPGQTFLSDSKSGLTCASYSLAGSPASYIKGLSSLYKVLVKWAQ